MTLTIPLATFGNIMGFDGILIFLVLLLLFGAKKLPELAKGLGSAVREFSKAKDEIHSEMTRAATPQPPQIAPPQYTEPHLTSAEHHGHTDAYGHTDEHGYIVPPDPAPSATGATPIVQTQPEIVATAPVSPAVTTVPSAPTVPVTEEHQNHPSHV
jgi:sec-independent protein translocase protein TatA